MSKVYGHLLAISFSVFSLACEESHYLDHIDKASLFADPTTQELDAIRAEWQERDLNISEYNVERSVDIGETGIVFKIVSYRTRGMEQYAALVIPKAEEEMPLRIYVNGFDIDNSVNGMRLSIGETFNNDPYAFALPALRGQSIDIEVNGIKYTTPPAEGNHCDAFDGAADDVISLMNLIDETEDKIDVNRTSVRGGSRGGTVALLVAERDLRVKAAVDVAGPTNMLELTAQNEDDDSYKCQFLYDLVENSISIEEARKKLLASSPLFFVETLPKTQLHLAAKDVIVPISQGYDLEARMLAASRGNLIQLFQYSDRDHSNIATDNTDLVERIEDFLSEL
jgi:pimeloyl-ACP methyl ester carboxylesterase